LKLTQTINSCGSVSVIFAISCGMRKPYVDICSVLVDESLIAHMGVFKRSHCCCWRTWCGTARNVSWRAHANMFTTCGCCRNIHVLTDTAGTRELMVWCQSYCRTCSRRVEILFHPQRY